MYNDPMKRFFTIVSASILVISIFLFKDLVFHSVITSLPAPVSKCLSSIVSTGVSAQSACTVPAGVADSLSAWQSDGTLRETNIYHTDANDRVGIGNTAPSYTLDVSGTIRSTGRIYPSDWVQVGNTGLYSTNNSAYLYPNNGTYGSWRIAGSRGNWYGLEFDTAGGQTALMMSRTTDTHGGQLTGVYNVTNNNWLWRWDHQTLAVGNVPWARLSSLPAYAANSSNGRVRAAETGCGSGYSGSCDGNGNGYMDYSDNLMSTSHPGQYYLYNTWDGTYWHLRSNHANGVRVGRADSANTASTASTATAAYDCNIDSYCYVNSLSFSGALLDLGVANTNYNVSSYQAAFLTINNYNGSYPYPTSGIRFCENAACTVYSYIHSSTTHNSAHLTIGGTGGTGTTFLTHNGNSQTSGTVSASEISASQDLYIGTGMTQYGVRFKHSCCVNPDGWLRFVRAGAAGTYHDVAVGAFFAGNAVRFDLAEMTPVDPKENLKIGELVSVNPSGKMTLIRAGNKKQNDAIGVVSHALTASMIIGGETGPEEIAHVKDKKPIALAGRVITLVNIENGPIESGDAITSSKKAGQGSKLVTDGWYAARAMESFDGSTPNSPGVTEIIEKLQERIQTDEPKGKDLEAYEEVIAELTKPLPEGSGRIITFVDGGYAALGTVEQLESRVESMEDDIEELKRQIELLQKK